LVSDNNPKSALFLAGSTNNEIFAFRLKATNDNIKLNDLTFSGANLNNLSNFRLKTPSGAYVSASTANNTAVTFVDMNLSEAVKSDSTVTYYLVADANSNTNSTGVVVDLDGS
jgi:hypothetical protein